MNTPADWPEANQRFLAGEVRRIRALLARHLTRDAGAAADPPPHATMEGDTPAALELLAQAFGLSAFERDMLLLAAAVELDGGVAALCATASGDPRRAQPTFGLALAALPDAHWSALAPSAPLRHWRLVERADGEGLTSAALRIDERILHYLTGVQHLDERLAAVLRPLGATPAPPPSHAALVQRLTTVLAGAGQGAAACVNLHGPGAPAIDAVVMAACARLGLMPHRLRAADVPVGAADRSALLRVWEREAILGGAVVVVDRRETTAHDAADSPVAALLEGTGGVVLVASRGPWAAARRTVVQLEVPHPTAGERRETLRAALNGAGGAVEQVLDTVADHFRLDAGAVSAVTAALDERHAGDDPGAALWELCRAQVRPRLDDLAARVAARARWDDLVLPRAQFELLRQVVLHVRHRARVHDVWGFGARSVRGLGVTALFAGQSGTGKTMAAEVLANELRLDLYRIDLSQVVSKYIGETEKNLRRIFDAAEEGSAILFFDEADALFGKRTEVKDSHDRYANIEVSYLLQRMEEYSGLAILTTNLKTALDAAFLRRLRFVVQFPFPGIAERAAIWRRAFPVQTPTEGLDFDRLARLDVAGGSIRNIALHAAFLAAAADEPLRMTHLLRAARDECGKLERPLSESEVAGWA